MKRRIRITTVLLYLSMMITLFGNVAFAASGSVTLSGGTAEVGKTVTVSGTVKCGKGTIGAATVTLTYDPSGLKFISGSAGTNGGSGSVVYSGYGDGEVKSLSFSLKFKVLKEGNFSISGIADAYNFDEQQLTMKVSSAVVKGYVVEDKPEEPKPNEPTTPKEPDDSTEQKPDKKSSNTKLTSLKIHPGTLSPAFSPDVKNYTAQVEEDVEEITISASPKHSKATFYVSGNEALKKGENNVKVVVTAEDGTTGSYIIKVTRGTKNQDLTIVNVGSETYSINEKIAKKNIPEGLVETKVMYEKKAYNGLSLSDGSMPILSLKAESGEEAFFVYDREAKTFYPFVQKTISEKQRIILLPLDVTGEKPEGMTATTITLDGHQWNVWGDEKGDSFLVNVRTSDGRNELYRYDMVDGTYQRVIEEPAKEKTTVVNKTDSVFPDWIAKNSDYIIIAGAGVIFSLFVVIIAVAANAEKRRRRRREKIERWKERIH